MSVAGVRGCAAASVGDVVSAAAVVAVVVAVVVSVSFAGCFWFFVVFS